MSILKIENLVKRYGDNLVLDEISFSVEKGEVISILGQSGSGKSTILRCINDLEDIQGGDIYLNDILIDHKAGNNNILRQKIGMVFQSYELFPHLKVIDNITIAPIKVLKKDKKEAEADARRLLKMVGLQDKENALPKELSGGQKQRVAIIRAMIMNPEVLLLDEITASLDPEMVREVLDVVLNLAKEGMTMLIVTHELQFAKAISDRILFLDKGKIIEDTTPQEFFKNPKTERAKAFLNVFEF